MLLGFGLMFEMLLGKTTPLGVVDGKKSCTVGKRAVCRITAIKGTTIWLSMVIPYHLLSVFGGT